MSQGQNPKGKGKVQKIGNEEIIDKIEEHGTVTKAADDLGIASESIRLRKRGPENQQFKEDVEDAIYDHHFNKTASHVDKLLWHVGKILEQAIVYEKDKGGNLILDDDGNPIPKSNLTAQQSYQVAGTLERIRQRGISPNKRQQLEITATEKVSPIDFNDGSWDKDRIKKVLDAANGKKIKDDK